MPARDRPPAVRAVKMVASSNSLGSSPTAWTPGVSGSSVTRVQRSGAASGSPPVRASRWRRWVGVERVASQFEDPELAHHVGEVDAGGISRGRGSSRVGSSAAFSPAAVGLMFGCGVLARTVTGAHRGRGGARAPPFRRPLAASAPINAGEIHAVAGRAAQQFASRRTAPKRASSVALANAPAAFTVPWRRRR